MCFAYPELKMMTSMFNRCVGLEQEGEPNSVQLFAIDPGMMELRLYLKSRE
jgi:hypothetical protein